MEGDEKLAGGTDVWRVLVRWIDMADYSEQVVKK